METDVLFEFEATCPVCEKKCKVTRTRSSKLMVDRRDTDFCVHYAGVDPYLYNVWGCSNCGYAGSENDFLLGISTAKQKDLQKFLQDKKVPFDFNQERDISQAIILHMWVLKLLEACNDKKSAFAANFLKLAWLYRKSEGNEDKEMECLKKALEYYRIAYDTEATPGKMSDLTLRYLIGELYRLTGNYSEATRWFSRVVSSPNGKYEPRTVRIAREQWNIARDQMKSAGQEDVVAPPVFKKETAAQTREPAPGRVRETRKMKISKTVSLYADDVEWLKSTLSAISERKLVLDTDAIVRSVLALVKPIKVDKKITTEEELTEYLREAILTVSKK